MSWWIVVAAVAGGFLLGVFVTILFMSDVEPVPSPYTVLEQEAVQKDVNLLGALLYEMKVFLTPKEWQKFSDKFYSGTRAWERLSRKDMIK